MYIHAPPSPWARKRKPDLIVRPVSPASRAEEGEWRETMRCMDSYVNQYNGNPLGSHTRARSAGHSDGVSPQERLRIIVKLHTNR